LNVLTLSDKDSFILHNCTAEHQAIELQRVIHVPLLHIVPNRQIKYMDIINFASSMS